MTSVPPLAGLRIRTTGGKPPPVPAQVRFALHPYGRGSPGEWPPARTKSCSRTTPVLTGVAHSRRPRRQRFQRRRRGGGPVHPRPDCPETVQGGIRPSLRMSSSMRCRRQGIFQEPTGSGRGGLRADGCSVGAGGQPASHRIASAEAGAQTTTTRRLTFCLRNQGGFRALEDGTALAARGRSLFAEPAFSGVRLFFVEHFLPCSWAFALADGSLLVRRTGGQHSPPPVFGQPSARLPSQVTEYTYVYLDCWRWHPTTYPTTSGKRCQHLRRGGWVAGNRSVLPVTGVAAVGQAPSKCCRTG